jgi:hypothetical protein
MGKAFRTGQEQAVPAFEQQYQDAGAFRDVSQDVNCESGARFDRMRSGVSRNGAQQAGEQDGRSDQLRVARWLSRAQMRSSTAGHCDAIPNSALRPEV